VAQVAAVRGTRPQRDHTLVPGARAPPVARKAVEPDGPCDPKSFFHVSNADRTTDCLRFHHLLHHRPSVPSDQCPVGHQKEYERARDGTFAVQH